MKTGVSGAASGAASDDQVAYCRAMARAHFPPFFGDVVEATPQRFVQPVFDICVPTYSNGRMALIGDAPRNATIRAAGAAPWRRRSGNAERRGSRPTTIGD